MVPVLYVILVVFQSVFWVGCGDAGGLTVHIGRGEAGQTQKEALPCPPLPRPPRSWLVVVTASPPPLPMCGLSSTPPLWTDES